MDAFTEIIDDKINKMNEKIDKLEKDIKHSNEEIEKKKDKEMKNLLLIQEDLNRRNNILE